MRWYDERSEASRDGFLRSGEIWDSLQRSGNSPVTKEISANLLRRTEQVEWQDLRRETWIMSTGEGLDSTRSRESTWDTETGEKNEKRGRGLGKGITGGEQVLKLLAMLTAILDSLSLKNQQTY